MPRIGKYDSRVANDLPNIVLSVDVLTTTGTNTSATITWLTRLKSVQYVFATPIGPSTTDASAIGIIGYTTTGGTVSAAQITTGLSIGLLAIGTLY